MNFDVLLVPGTPGEAPLGLNTTGNSIFNRIWTGLHVPAVTVPVFTGPTGLPMGAQLGGPFGADQKALVCAEWVRRALTIGGQYTTDSRPRSRTGIDACDIRESYAKDVHDER